MNRVGVNVNTASKYLLTYVSGLGPTLAENVVNYIKENGAFRSRNELKKVKDVSVKFVDEELEQVLDALLGKVNLSYRIEQGVIIIVPGKVKNEEKEV